MRNRFLLVSRTGPNSLHRHWLSPATGRNFDLFLSSYDPAAVAPDAVDVRLEYRPGTKVAGYGAFLRAHEALWKAYDYVALFDDDLLVDAAGISRLFDLVSRHDLKIAQPALTRDSHFTYPALLRHPGFLLRHVTYIEMMCPVFRTDVLEEVLPLFERGYESGIDLIWGNLVHERPEDFAVIDAVPVRHTRPVGAGKQANGFTDGRRYEDDINAILAEFGSDWLPCVPYGGVLSNGRRVRGRRAVALSALSLLPAVTSNPPLRMNARNMAVYWKHLFSAPARNVRLEWPTA